MTDKEIKLENYRRANAAATKGETVLTGSSLMEMFPVNKFLEEAGNSKIVYNRAIGGYITDELLNSLEVCVYQLMPRRVFINIGTNDLSDSVSRWKGLWATTTGYSRLLKSTFRASKFS